MTDNGVDPYILKYHVGSCIAVIHIHELISCCVIQELHQIIRQPGKVQLSRPAHTGSMVCTMERAREILA
jgi:hypothetical protein